MRSQVDGGDIRKKILVLMQMDIPGVKTALVKMVLMVKWLKQGKRKTY
jgi:hypothetical protein